MGAADFRPPLATAKAIGKSQIAEAGMPSSQVRRPFSFFTNPGEPGGVSGFAHDHIL
jgi:hypothetical protein